MGTSGEKSIKNKEYIIKEGDLSTSKNSKTQDISEFFKESKPPELFNKNMLEFHNKFRKKHHSNKLEIDIKLTNKANKYAEVLLGISENNERINIINEDILGENIYISDKEEKEKNICQYWYNENKKYNYELNNFQKDTNHFTQLIWNSTKFIGFGYANHNNKNCYVALYYPTGNIFGQFTNNVFKI